MFGNSLLDISVQIKDDELLKKYNLEKNGQKEVSLAKISKLLGDAKARYELLLILAPLSIKQRIRCMTIDNFCCGVNH